MLLCLLCSAAVAEHMTCTCADEDYRPSSSKAPRRRRPDPMVTEAHAEEREPKQCANCGTTESGGGAWRRYKGARMCNACGVYPKQKEHLGEMRPLSCIEKGAVLPDTAACDTPAFGQVARSLQWDGSTHIRRCLDLQHTTSQDMTRTSMPEAACLFKKILHELLLRGSSIADLPIVCSITSTYMRLWCLFLPQRPEWVHCSVSGHYSSPDMGGSKTRICIHC